MNHGMEPEYPGGSKKMKYGKTQCLTVDKLDDGTFTARVNDEKGNSKKYSYQSVKDLMVGISDEMGGKKVKDMMADDDEDD